MTISTTIRVPSRLHGRLSQAASKREMTMAQYIEEMMDHLEEEAFWSAWANQATLGHVDTQTFDGTLRDGLSDDESFDWKALA